MINGANFSLQEMTRGACAIKNYLLNRMLSRALESPFRTIDIRPDRIRWKLTRVPGNARNWNVGGVLDGDWDLSVHNAIGLKYHGIYERYVLGLGWEETGLFKHRYKKALDAGFLVRGCRTIDELVRQYEERYDSLYLSMKVHGVMTPAFFGPTIQPIYVFIGRAGEILWYNGNHRLYLARILKVEKMAVRVWARHKQWQELRQRIALGGETDLSRKLLNHPDLQSLAGCRATPQPSCVSN